MSVIETDRVSFTYPQSGSPHHATIDQISFSVERGETVGIIGHTGSGKSTLLQTLNGLIKPDSGTVFLGGRDLWSNPKEIYQKRFRVGLVFQYPEYQLFEETVYKDIAYGPTNMGLSEAEIDTRVREYAALLGLSEAHLQKSPFDLSGGEKRRAALAGILAMEPEILVLDEPTAGLDPIGRETLFRAIRQYQEKHNAGIIVVSHSMEDLARLCDRLLVLHRGTAKMFGRVDEVFSRSEELMEMGLDVPMVTRVLLRLKQLGLAVDTGAYTVEAALQNILQAESGGERHA